jgi:hypothetical protein
MEKLQLQLSPIGHGVLAGISADTVARKGVWTSRVIARMGTFNEDRDLRTKSLLL